jgi:outer membrane protein assembly factor BamB
LLPAQAVLGLPPVTAGPVPGYVLVADRNNNRVLIVSPTGRVVWQFPHPGDLKAGQTFRDPDDAFFTPDYRAISTNEEFNDQLARISLRQRRIFWTYGEAGVAGSGQNELSNPDDAYLLRNGLTTVADIRNCRVLWIDRRDRIVRQLGSAARCVHDPPRSLSSPNGATPLPDGGMLVTEIGGWADRISASGRLLYAVRTPTTYPSDAQLLPNGNILVAGFNTPGRVDEITPRGRIVWTYGPSSGPGSLDRPSLAVRWPNGMIAVTDDWHHRIVVIDPRTKRIVWQYGHFGVASSAPGYLSKPDGLDLLPSAVVRSASAGRVRVSVTRIGALPEAASRIAAVRLPDGRLMAMGGLVAGTSSRSILAGPPSRLVQVGLLPTATHDAAAALVGSRAYVFGGGEATSSPAIFSVDGQGRSRRAGSIGEPLSDLGAVSIGKTAYLVGGYTGSRYATAILRYRPGRTPSVVARLPVGLRYAGVALLGGRIYVAGGVTTAGTSSAVYAVDPGSGVVAQLADLPAPIAHAPLVALDGSLYLLGGADASGSPVASILGIDPTTGTVTRVGRLPGPLADAAAVRSGASIVVLGGKGASPSAAVLEVRISRRVRG